MHLTRLNLSANQVTDLRPLSGLDGLTLLTLVGNPLRDVTPVMGLKNLVTLRLGHTLVRDLSQFREHCDLSLESDSLSDLSGLAGRTKLAGLPGLKSLLVLGNPLDCAAQAANLNALNAGGVAVTSDASSG